jgi:hypothetical protein
MARKRAPKPPPLTDAEIDELVAEHMPKCAYPEMRALEAKLKKMSPAKLRDYGHEVTQDMIATGLIVEYPPGSNRYILKFWLDLIAEHEDEWTKQHRPDQYNPNGLRVLKRDE